MRRRHEEHVEEEGGSERWLLTYSDMITLLLALFIILYAMGEMEKSKFEAISENFAEAFHTTEGGKPANPSAGGAGVYEDGSGVYLSGNASAGDTVSGNRPVGTVADPLDTIYEVLNDYVHKNHLEDSISLTQTSAFVRIRLKGNLMFYPDSSRLLPGSEPVLKEIAGALSKIYNQVDHITISGHTATTGEYTDSNNAIAWSLSANRASQVMNKIMEFGISDVKLSLEAHGHNVPVDTNDSEEGRAKNRRAEIVVYKSYSES